MNIFDVLSQGRGRLNEENLSAMLGFLLSPHQTHGLGDIFLRHFLDAVAQSCKEETRFNNAISADMTIEADVFLEEPYSLGKRKRIVDIEIRIYEKASQKGKKADEKIEVHRIAIENKIKAQTAKSDQFKEEFICILNDVKNDQETNATMVFLTPKIEHKKLTEEYEMLDDKTLGRHKKSWLHWSDHEDGDNTIAGLIKDILRKETRAEIPPMTEYLRHTLKAFVRHLFEISKGPSPSTLKGWGIDEVVFVEIPKGKYRVERYENSTIRVVNLQTQKWESAKPILERIIHQRELGIDLYDSKGSEKNSRILGDEVIKELIRQGKNLK